MAASDSSITLVDASLHALMDPPATTSGRSPRELLVAVSSAWADDRRAWELARQLMPAAEACVVRLEQQLAERPGDDALVRLRARARYAHLVAVAMYRQLRLPARRPLDAPL